MATATKTHNPKDATRDGVPLISLEDAMAFYDAPDNERHGETLDECIKGEAIALGSQSPRVGSDSWELALRHAVTNIQSKEVDLDELAVSIQEEKESK